MNNVFICRRRIGVAPPPSARLESENGAFVLFSSYDAEFVSALKNAVPNTDRRWDGTRKAWIISPVYGAVVQRLVKKHLALDIEIPLVTSKAAQVTRMLKIEYIGACKDRGGSMSAYGYVDGGWNAVFPEMVLTDWFDARPTGPSRQQTLYGVLGLKREAALDEVKTSYRRLARQWYPDVCKEPDAREQFLAIQHAYEVLSDPRGRRKYDAGLTFESGFKSSRADGAFDKLSVATGYRSPLRCGYILAEGIDVLGRMTVNKILAWEDITRPDGAIMSTSWPAGSDHFTTSWILV